MWGGGLEMGCAHDATCPAREIKHASVLVAWSSLHPLVHVTWKVQSFALGIPIAAAGFFISTCSCPMSVHALR